MTLETTSTAARISNRRLYHETLLAGENRPRHQPLEIYLEITTHCNIRCVFCAREHDLGYLTGQRVGNVAPELLDKVSHLLEASETIYPLGFGEPFLHKSFLGLVEKAKSLGAAVQFNTNGTLIGREEAERLVKARADRMVLSLDGATKETFERIRLGASFDRILDNMRTLHRLKVEAKSAFPRIYLEFVAMRSNFHELPLLVDLAREIGSGHVHVEPLVAHSPDLRDEQIFDYTEEPFRSIVAEMRERARRRGVRLTGRGVSEDLPALRDPESGLETDASAPVVAEAEGDPIDRAVTELDDEPSSDETDDAMPSPAEIDGFEGHEPVSLLCSQPFSTIYVGYQGRVGTCCLGHHELGDLSNQTIDEIWAGEKFAELRDRMRTGRVPADCKACVLQNRIPPMRFNHPDLRVESPSLTLDEEVEPAPIDEELDLRLTLLESRRVPRTDELYLKVRFEMNWSHPLSSEVLVEAVEPDGTRRPLVPPATAVFPPGYDETRSLRLVHGVRDAAGGFPRQIQVTVRDQSTGTELITRLGPVQDPEG